MSSSVQRLAAQLIKADVLGALLDLVEDEDGGLRILVSGALQLLADNSSGKMLFDADVVGRFSVFLNNPIVNVRANTYAILLTLAKSVRGIQACVDAGLIPRFVEKAGAEGAPSSNR